MNVNSVSKDICTETTCTEANRKAELLRKEHGLNFYADLGKIKVGADISDEEAAAYAEQAKTL